MSHTPPDPKKASKIFICYRREDSIAVTGRIYDRLVGKFGKEAVFKAVDSIPLGRDFRTYIDSVIRQCDVVLVIIGDRWLEARGRAANRRIDEAKDFFRIEIETALKRDVPVVPVLVQTAEMPAEEILPGLLLPGSTHPYSWSTVVGNGRRDGGRNTW